MKIYELRHTQFIPATLEECWDFFSSPKNLKKITPKHMGFEITNNPGEKMYQGQIITYFVKPIAGIPLSWVTEITTVKEPLFFIDEQRFGPYTFWHHQHWFKEVGGGVEMTDIVHYALPLGFLGRIANRLFVKKQLNKIFNCRIKAVEDIFGTDPKS
jgi:ligand-binding SRPBCC domain-containing protein